MIQRKDVDEVWLALQEAKSAFIRDGHAPSISIDACQSCHALFLVQRAIQLYPRTRIVVERRNNEASV